MIVYSNSLEDAHGLIQFFRSNAATLRNLRKIIITREKTTVLDVNGDGIEFPGLTYGSPVLEELMRELGVIMQPTGDHQNVLKTKPPLVIERAGADFFVAMLDRVLSEGW